MNRNIQDTARESSLFLLAFSIRMNSSITMISYRRFAPGSLRERDTPKFKNIIRIPGAQFEIRQLVFARERTKGAGGRRRRRRREDDGVLAPRHKTLALSVLCRGVSTIRENERESRMRRIGCTTRGRGFSEHLPGELISSRR